jgi:tetraacyldisaccharide 4'-kinase
VVAFSGLAHPEAFEQTLVSLGASVIDARRWPDHHAYSANDIRSMLDDKRHGDAELFVTSEKDAVKLADLGGVDPDRIAVLHVAIDFVGEDGTILDDLLDRSLRRSGAQ